MTNTSLDASTQTQPDALMLQRMLALLYDLWPVVALWMLLSALFNLGYFVAGHGEREILKTGSALGILLWLCCWLLAGVYAVMSWSRGGQTLGMRAWRLRVTGMGETPPTRKQLIQRYAVGTGSLLLGGLGFWWAWFGRDRLTWHDRVSGTRMVRVPKR